MKGKKLLAVLLAGVLACSTMACGGTKTETGDSTVEDNSAEQAETTGKGYKIGFSLMTVSDAVIAQTIQDAEDYIAGLGGELLVSDAENDAAKQLDAVENFIESGCDAIIIQAIDATSMSEQAKKAMDQGIKVVAYGIGLDNCDVWYKNDNTVTGTAIGEMAADWINSELGGTANVCIIGYSLMDVLVERANAIEAALKANCENVNIVASFDAIDSQTGMSNTESMLAAHSDVNVICAISDGPAVGAYEAVKASGRDTDDFGIFGSDLSIVALNYINEGTCYRGTIDCDNTVSGTTAIQICYDLLEGNQVDDTVIMGCQKVTAENIADYAEFIE
jgi:ABC-type sugar transport system substrate-binding protein